MLRWPSVRDALAKPSFVSSSWMTSGRTHDTRHTTECFAIRHSSNQATKRLSSAQLQRTANLWVSLCCTKTQKFVRKTAGSRATDPSPVRTEGADSRRRGRTAVHGRAVGGRGRRGGSTPQRKSKCQYDGTSRYRAPLFFDSQPDPSDPASAASGLCATCIACFRQHSEQVTPLASPCVLRCPSHQLRIHASKPPSRSVRPSARCIAVVSCARAAHRAKL